MSERTSKSNILAAGLLSLSFIFSLLMLRDYGEYRAGAETYAAVSESCTMENEMPEETETEVTTKEPEAEAVPEDLTAPVTVDFQKLLSINTDVIGWLYIGAFPISYPILHAGDNETYLRTTIEHKSNNAGSIFSDHACSSDFKDRNTVIYGHNMHDDTMFGKLKWFLKSPDGTDYFKKDDTFWIITPERTCKYKIFSVFTTEPGGEAYTLFQKKSDLFADWCRMMKERSEIRTVPELFTERTRVVTLSTCAEDTSRRLVVMGRLVRWSENREE
jgi:sortase B